MPKPLSIPANTKVSRWSSLTDEELLHSVFVVGDPSQLVNLLTSVPETDEIPEVEATYDTLVSGAGKVRCVHCKKTAQNHNRGFVMVFQDGSRMLVGKDCGRNLYKAEFGFAERAFRDAENKASYLKRRLLVLDAAPGFLAGLENARQHRAIPDFEATRKKASHALSELVVLVGEEIKKRDGSLIGQTRVRDFEAEARREEKDDALRKSMTPAEIKRGEKSGLLMRPGRKPRPMYRYEDVSMGLLSGLGFWRADHFPGTIMASLEQRLRGSLAHLRDHNLSLHDYSLFFRNLADLIADLRGQIDRLNELPQAFAPDNLQTLARWASSLGPHSYEVKDMEIMRVDADGHVVTFEEGKGGYHAAAVRMPLGFVRVSSDFIDDFLMSTTPK